MPGAPQKRQIKEERESIFTTFSNASCIEANKRINNMKLNLYFSALLNIPTPVK